MTSLTEFEKTCFVIMPFGKKKVGGKDVDFDIIYSTIFEPAISATPLSDPHQGNLVPRRTDADKFSSAITQDMFEYIMYSRIAFTDISGLNPNVFYELGVRHRSQESGTVLFRQVGTDLPFDINTIKVFEYDHDGESKAAEARSLITEVLTETLQRNRLDSPVRIALRAQRQDAEDAENPAVHSGKPMPNLDWLLREAEEALRTGDAATARIIYSIVLRIDPTHTMARMRLGLVLRQQNLQFDALEEFACLTKLVPDYAEAWREKGVIEGLIHRLVEEDERPAWLPSGEESLKRATALNADDFDAWASWGGVLRRKPDNAAALEKYQRSADVSDGHPYPLLNALKLEAVTTGKLDLDTRQDQLDKAENLRKGQAMSDPPADIPWCYFDLAELRLYREDPEGFMTYLDQGLSCCTAPWMVKSFRDALKDTLVASGIDFPGLSEGMTRLEQALANLKKHKET